MLGQRVREQCARTIGQVQHTKDDTVEKPLDGDAQIPRLTPEQVEVGIRLEEIFMPHAQKQRKEVYKKQYGDARSREPIRFAHYTSAEAALKIIKSKRIWMRNTTCMSDYREVQHGFDILRKFFSDKSKLGAFAG